MTKIYFVRHAEPNYSNHNDVLRELTPKGMEDRKRVTEFLADKHIDVVLSSPYKRAVDTVIRYYDDSFGYSDLQSLKNHFTACANWVILYMKNVFNYKKE